MIVAGLDLSLRGTGVAVVDTTQRWLPLLFLEGSPAPDTADGERPGVAVRAERVALLAERILADLAPLPLDLAVLEGPVLSVRHGLQHERAGLWWMVAEGLRRRGVPTAEVAPTGRAVYATGRRNASKPSVVAATVPRYGLHPRNDNIADAMILAAMGARYLGHAIDDPLPPRHTAALHRVLWPVLDPERHPV